MNPNDAGPTASGGKACLADTSGRPSEAAIAKNFKEREMDLNELLRAHQLEIMKANSSGDANHFGMIAEYAERIRQLRSISQSAPTAQATSAPPRVIYGSYAGNSAKESAAPLQRALEGSYCDQNENPDRGRADA